MASPPRLAGVDGLRGLAAVAIVLLHVWMYTGANRPDHSVVVDAIAGELRLGLTYFFVLSGFLLARPWLRAALEDKPRPALGRYAVQRAARLLPGYWLALLGAYLVLHGTGHPREVDAGALPIFAVFAQNQVAAVAGQLNPPTWSLGVEVGFYLLLPLAGVALVRAAGARGRAGVLAVCGALIVVGLAWTLAGELADWPRTAMTSPLTYLPVFACGIAAAALVHQRTVAPRVTALMLCAGSALVIGNGIWHNQGTDLVGHVLLDLPAAAGFGAIIVVVTSRPSGLLDLAPMRWLGSASYGTYLWHMPVLYWLQLRDALPEDPLRACVAVLVPTVALGALSWIAVERPVLRFIARRTARRPHTAGTGARPREPLADTT